MSIEYFHISNKLSLFNFSLWIHKDILFCLQHAEDIYSEMFKETIIAWCKISLKSQYCTLSLLHKTMGKRMASEHCLRSPNRVVNVLIHYMQNILVVNKLIIMVKKQHHTCAKQDTAHSRHILNKQAQKGRFFAP